MTPAGSASEGITIEDNQDRDCLSLRYVNPADPDDDDVIHICDWPALKAAVDQHQRERGGRFLNLIPMSRPWTCSLHKTSLAAGENCQACLDEHKARSLRD